MPPAAEEAAAELPFELSSKVLDDAGQSAVSAALKIAGWTARLNQVEDRLTLPLEEAVQTLAAKGTPPAAASPSLPNAGTPEELSPAVLRSELKRKIKVLQSKLSETLSQIRHIGVRMPELPDILSADSRLAQEAADLARAREKGDSQALAAALSAESSRKLLSWESRLEVKSRLDTLEQTLAAMSKRFQADRPWLLAPRSKYADERPETMETLRKIDRRLINEEEALSSMSAEIETLAEKVEILRGDLPDDALSGINPLEGALLESLKIVLPVCAVWKLSLADVSMNPSFPRKQRPKQTHSSPPSARVNSHGLKHGITAPHSLPPPSSRQPLLIECSPRRAERDCPLNSPLCSSGRPQKWSNVSKQLVLP